MERYGFIDTDSHVIEPDDLWDKYLEPKYREEAPIITRVGYKTDENGFGFYNDVTVGGINQPIGFFGTTAVMPDLGEVYDDYARQGFPASSYVEAMDKVGIDLMVLYPTAGLYTNQAPNTRADAAVSVRRALFAGEVIEVNRLIREQQYARADSMLRRARARVSGDADPL